MEDLVYQDGLDLGQGVLSQGFRVVKQARPIGGHDRDILPFLERQQAQQRGEERLC